MPIPQGIHQLQKTAARKAPDPLGASISSAEIRDLICPITILAISGSIFQPSASEILWKTQGHVDIGGFGRISIGPILKKQLHPSLTFGSGRISRYYGEVELVAFKSPRDINTQTIKKSGQFSGPVSRSNFIPFGDVIQELAYLSAPDILYHENIVDLLGYFWEPYGASTNIVYAPTLIMEFADQGSLRSFLSLGRNLSTSTKLGLCVDISRALQTLHHELVLNGNEPFGVYHGDLKPDNILIFSKPETSIWSKFLWHTGWFGSLVSSFWNLIRTLSFNKPAEKQYQAKLCDLGSCLRYHPTKLPQRSALGFGTVGWRAPELIEKHDAMPKESSDIPVDPLRAEIFAFGLIIAYVFLEKEPFRIPEVATFLAEKYFGTEDMSLHLRNPSDIILASGKENLQKLQQAQQWMISYHLDDLVHFLLMAVSQLKLPIAAAEAVIGVLSLVLRKDPHERILDFSDVCLMLGGDPRESRKRTPTEPIINTLALNDTLLSVQSALISIALTASMPYSFREWLNKHLELVFEQAMRGSTEDHRLLAGHIALMRGLMSFIPPEVALKSEQGLSWIKKAIDFGYPQAITIYSRLGGSQGSFPLVDDWVLQLQAEVAKGSLLAREELVHNDPLTSWTVNLEEIFKSVKEDENPHISRFHTLALKSTQEAIRLAIDEALDRSNNVESQSLSAVEKFTNNRLNYAISEPGTALHWAIATNNLLATEALIKLGASPYTRNLRGNTAWSLAVGARLLPIIQLLAESCPCKNLKSRHDFTIEGIYRNPLHLRLATGRNFVQHSLDVFQYLWKIKAMTRKEAYKSTVSVCPASPELLEQLLEVDYSIAPDIEMLQEVLLDAITFSDRQSVRIILKRLPTFETSNYSIHALSAAIRSDEAASFDVFLELLNHVRSDFNINVHFTMLYAVQTGGPTISTTEGVTLLHYAFSRGKTRAAIALLEHSANASIMSLDKNNKDGGMTPLGHLLFSATHYNHLALCDFLKSPYIKENPDFLLRNAVVNSVQRQNVFHLLCSGEDERVHNSAKHKMSSLYELIRYFRSISEKDVPGARKKLTDLVNAPMLIRQEVVTPLLLAVQSGFSQAIPLLVLAGANLLEDVGKCEGFQGWNALRLVDTRNEGEWEELFMHKYRMITKKHLPWIEINSPVAQKMKRDYEERTWMCVQEIREILLQTEDGRLYWEKRKAYREADGLRVD